MADLLSEDRKIIAEHPLHDVLDPLRGVLRAAEQSYNAAVASSDPAAQKAVSRLLYTLQGHEVALDLRSKFSDQNVASELATLFRRIQNRDFKYEYYRSLVRLVIDKKSDAEIWSAVLNLITTISRVSPPASIVPSFDDTPIRHSSASQQGREQTRQVVEARVFEEIRDCTYRGVSGFHAKYFEGNKWGEKADNVWRAAKDRHVGGRWMDFPDPPTQDAVLGWWFRFQEEFLPEERGMYFKSPNKNMVGPEAHGRLDLFVKPNGAGASKTDHNGKDVWVIGELKKPKEDLKGTLLQIGRYVREAFAHQPTRRFVHAFTLCGTEMETWVFDRSGPYSGPVFDIHEEPERFIRVLAGYVMMDDAELGLDTFVKSAGGKPFITIRKGGTRGGRKLQLGTDPIAFQRAIVCRGTSCYLAKPSRAKDYGYVVKFSWTSDLRPPEADLLEKARKRGVKGIAKVFGHRCITEVADLRKGLTFTEKHTFRNTASTPSASFSQSQQTFPSRSFSQFHGLSIAEGPPKKRKSVDVGGRPSKMSRTDSQRFDNAKRVNEVTYAVENTKPTSLLTRNQAPFDNRIFRCLVVSPPGITVSDFWRLHRVQLGEEKSSMTPVRTFLEALRDAIKAHESLLMDGKVLHRDISENNIIVTDPKKADGFVGRLIDLDLAKELDREPSGARHRTGTMEFMAIEVLLGYSHTYRHDLESFFYVLLWVCARHGLDFIKSSTGQPKRSHFARWYTGSYEDIANVKRGNMDKQGIERLMMEFPPSFNSVKPLCRTIRDILFPYRDGLFVGTPTDPKVLYEPIITAFDDAIAILASEQADST